MHASIIGAAFGLLVCAAGAVLTVQAPPNADAVPSFHVYITNERSGDVTVIDPRDNQVIATIPVGKRPRGICADAHRSRLYVALSGSPITSPNEKKGAETAGVAVDPGNSSTNATTSSLPETERPITADWTTAGCSFSTASTSGG